MQPTPQQTQALKTIISAVVETVREAGSLGAPAGPLYAALMTQGCTLSQFESLMGALVRLGKIRQDGHLYFIN